MRFRPSTLGLLHYHLGYSRVFTVHLVCVHTSHVSSFILSLGVSKIFMHVSNQNVLSCCVSMFQKVTSGDNVIA